MFTGIIQTTGSIISRDQKNGRTYFVIQPKNFISDVKTGDSISVSGVCLTIVKIHQESLTFEVMPETMRKTTLANVKIGDIVNLEPALQLSDRLGGHLVSGHVDAVGEVTEILAYGGNKLVTVLIPTELTKYVILHGSITFDGISLTVARLDENKITVSLIKETIDRTTWGLLAVEQKVNVEVDVMGKYVEKLINN